MRQRAPVLPTPCPAEEERGNEALSVGPVVCAYTEMRWQRRRAALKPVLVQCPGPAQVLVVDHNTGLATWTSHELAGVSVLESDGAPGLSGARHAELRAATQPIAALLDDGAEAQSGWLASLIKEYSAPRCCGHWGKRAPSVGGLLVALAATSIRLGRWLWLSRAAGLGNHRAAPDRRRHESADPPTLEVGGFDALLGQSASGLRGCEETELDMRLTASRPKSVVHFIPAATGVIPAALLRDLRRLAAGHLGAFMRMIATIAGLAATVMGYLPDRAGRAGRSRIRRQILSRRVASHSEC